MEDLSKVFIYDETSPTFLRWAIDHSSVKIGDVAGYIYNNKYSKVFYKRKSYQVHRVIWELHNGVKPPPNLYIDHIDGNPNNNKIDNLRLATNQQNQWNSEKQCNNTSGVKGVYWNKQHEKWAAQVTITVDGKKGKKWLGAFATIDEAAEAYNKFCKERFGEFYREG